MAGRPELDRLIADLEKMPAELRTQLRPALRRAAEPILQDARGRASWSSRIPGAISIKTSFTARNPGVRLVVNSNVAPHARPYEFGSGRNRNLRHPVFGHRDRWVEQRTRPFFFPAVQAGAEGVMRETSAAVLAAARASGFR